MGERLSTLAVQVGIADCSTDSPLRQCGTSFTILRAINFKACAARHGGVLNLRARSIGELAIVDRFSSPRAKGFIDIAIGRH